ncbi:MAG: hypothetical protein RIS72_572, partial [Pseudomonadota bacterium]
MPLSKTPMKPDVLGSVAGNFDAFELACGYAFLPFSGACNVRAGATG